jgi:hypothetical protein
MDLDVVVMAAGLGARYGGLKQIEPVGPRGETLLDYALYDAHRAGFGRVVFVIRREIEAAFREAVGRRFEARLEVAYAFQEPDLLLPPGFRVPSARSKPWGTGHAVLAARPQLAGAFAVVNADDYYGPRSFSLLHGFLVSPAESTLHALVGFRLDETLSEHGAVARGLCAIGPDGHVARLEEVLGIERAAEGIVAPGPDGLRRFQGDERVSLNLWGFRPGLFEPLGELFERFLLERGDDAAAEFFLTDAVDELMLAGRARVQLLESPDPWFGVTHRADAGRVAARLARLVREGRYPDPLWEV